MGTDPVVSPQTDTENVLDALKLQKGHIGRTRKFLAILFLFTMAVMMAEYLWPLLEPGTQASDAVFLLRSVMGGMAILMLILSIYKLPLYQALSHDTSTDRLLIPTLVCLALISGIEWAQGSSISVFDLALITICAVSRLAKRWIILAILASCAIVIGIPFGFGITPPLREAVFLALTSFIGLILVLVNDQGRQQFELERKLLKRKNAELRELAIRDILTGLYNRAYVLETSTSVLSSIKRYGGELHILMLDIDHFKRVNDALGHPVGDTVLKQIASIMLGSIRMSDSAARWGGEEFLLFLPYAQAEEVQIVANRIRDTVAGHKFPSVPWRITVSIGIASVRADDNLDSLVDRADRFLYASKQGGRNRVTGY